MTAGDGDELKQAKAALRREAQARRRALEPAWRAEASAAITRRILDLPEVQSAATVALFASFGAEVDTHPLIAELIRQKGSLALPRALREPRQLEFRRVQAFPAACRPAFHGILEPDPSACPELVEAAALDLILVPGLLFDRRGYRLGYGGGYYDRLLAPPRAARAIGLAFSAQLSAIPLPSGPWDYPVDAICTEAGLIEPAR